MFPKFNINGTYWYNVEQTKIDLPQSHLCLIHINSRFIVMLLLLIYLSMESIN